MNFLFFSPYQAIEKHSYPEAMLVKMLQANGHRVSYLACRGILSDFCIAHSAYGLNEQSSPEEKKFVCRQCRNNFVDVRKAADAFAHLENYFDPKMEEEISKEVARLSVENIFDIRFRDYPVGQFASYEFILNHKISEMSNLSPERFQDFKIFYRNVLRGVLSFEAYFQKNKIDKVLVYNSGYSMNATVFAVAKRFGVATMFFHSGMNLGNMVDSLYFSHDNITEFNIKSIRYFLDNIDKIHVDYEKIELPLSHLSTGFRAKSVFTYSAARDPNSHNRLKRKFISGGAFRKTVLLTMSSGDETYAADFAFMNFSYVKNAKRIFSDPFQWVRETIEFFANYPDILLIVRVHPREFPNKREKVVNSRARDYEILFQNLPSNVVVDHPADGNSLYDLFEIVDFQLVAQSTSGLEAAILGVPSISTVSRMGMYPIPHLTSCPENREEYFLQIQKYMAGDYPNLDDLMKRALEWYLFVHNDLQFNFASGNFWNESEGSGVISKLRKKIRRLSGLSRYSFSRYVGSFVIDNSVREEMLELICATDSNLEVYKLREKKLFSRRTQLQEEKIYLKSFFAGLFGLYYGIDNNQFDRYVSFSSDGSNLSNTRMLVFKIDEKAIGPTLKRSQEGAAVFTYPPTAKIASRFSSLLTNLYQS